MKRAQAEALTKKALKVITAGPAGGNPKQTLKVLRGLADQISTAQKAHTALLSYMKKNRGGKQRLDIDNAPFPGLGRDLRTWSQTIDEAATALDSDIEMGRLE